jgi:hypothetical protein
MHMYGQVPDASTSIHHESVWKRIRVHLRVGGLSGSGDRPCSSSSSFPGGQGSEGEIGPRDARFAMSIYILSFQLRITDF